jgi:hypothetical protein
MNSKKFVSVSVANYSNINGKEAFSRREYQNNNGRERENFFRGLNDETRKVKKKESGESKNRSSFRIKRKEDREGEVNQTSGIMPFGQMTLTSKLPFNNFNLLSDIYHRKEESPISDDSPRSISSPVYSPTTEKEWVSSPSTEQSKDDFLDKDKHFNDVFGNFIKLVKKM